MLKNGRQRLVEEWSDDDATFVTDNRVSNTTILPTVVGNITALSPTAEVAGNNNQWCHHCSTEARMSGCDVSRWRVSGVCQSEGCPGYKGHLPASRPQGDHDNDDDDVPLLFSPLSSASGVSTQELEMVDHCHGLEPVRDSSAKARRQLAIATVLCSVFVTGEVIGGYLSGSLAIMGDAAHMFSDLASFGVSLAVLYISDRKPTKRMTFGYHRAEALGALATLAIIWYVTGILVYLAIKRIQDQDFEIHDTTMLVVAVAAVAFNILLGLTLHGVCGLGHGHGHSHHGHSHSRQGDNDDHQRHINIRAALIHVLGDLLQSIGVLISSLLIKFFGESFKIADPICTLIFAVIIVVTTLTVLRDTLAILLEATPRGVKYDQVTSDLANVPGVVSVHSLHLWSLTADIPVASVHITINQNADQEDVRNQAVRLLRSKHKIWRSTIQIEHHQAQVNSSCEKCQPLLR